LHAPQVRAGHGKVELADIVRRHGAAFRAEHRLCSVQHRALNAIERCRTAALGGELYQCDSCNAQRYVYHSCRNRHCPKCQTRAKERWLEARRAELLPVPYYHLVFTLPHELNPLARHAPRQIYAMLFATASATLIEFGRNPRWLGGDIAATLVLHTWGQTLSQHLHVHCLIAAGALSEDGAWRRSRRGFLFPVKALAIVFRAKFLAALSKLPFQPPLLAGLRAKPWVVYAKRPFAGPELVLEYLGRYTHRTAISNDRLLSAGSDSVRFRYKDYARGNRRKVMQLDAAEFLRRFSVHVLPRGFNRIRHYGLLANRNKRALLTQARSALAAPAPPAPVAESVSAFWQRIAGINIERCRHCHAGTLRLVAVLSPTPHRPP
jgi:putative transposase/transposase-like zinc-binding protein